MHDQSIEEEGRKEEKKTGVQSRIVRSRVDHVISRAARMPAVSDEFRQARHHNPIRMTS